MADAFLDAPFSVVGRTQCCRAELVSVIIEVHGELGPKLKRLPAALSRPFLRVLMTVKLGAAVSSPPCKEAGAVRSESKAWSGLHGSFGLPEPALLRN